MLLLRGSIKAGTLILAILGALLAPINLAVYAAEPATDKLIYGWVGHSLTDPIPGPFMGIAKAPFDHLLIQSIPGAPLLVNWNDAKNTGSIDQPYTVNLRDRLEAIHDVDVLILTENGGIAGNLEWNDTLGYLKKWQAQGVKGNSDLKTFWYWVWPEIPNWSTAPDWNAWIASINEELAKSYGPAIEAIATDIGPDKITVIPANEALKALYDAVQKEEIRGLTNYADLFSDSIHLSPLGGYYVALVHWSTVHRTSPVGRPWNVSSSVWSPEKIEGLTADMAADMQEVVWRVVERYPHAGVAK